jgi:hypothetical protein
VLIGSGRKESLVEFVAIVNPGCVGITCVSDSPWEETATR